MTKTLALMLLVFGAIAYAELPDVLIDPAQREALEYVDAKTSTAVNLANNAQTATSTVTFSGWIDIGYVAVSSNAVGTQLTASCPTGKVLTGGGGSCNIGYVTGSGPLLGPGGWTLTCSGAGSNYAYAYCARIK